MRFSLRILVAVCLLSGGIAGGRAGAQSIRAAGPAAWFGLALDCGECNDLHARAEFVAPAVITRVVEGGPAAKANMMAGDTVIAVDGEPVSARQLRVALGSAQPNQILRLTIGRATGRSSVELTARYVPTMMVKRDTLGLRYRGTFNGLQVEVMGPATPIISRDSTGRIMYIGVGGHVIRLTNVP
jgi:C-terminal processing protease CtpA/Prc